MFLIFKLWLGESDFIFGKNKRKDVLFSLEIEGFIGDVNSRYRWRFFTVKVETKNRCWSRFMEEKQAGDGSRSKLDKFQKQNLNFT